METIRALAKKQGDQVARMIVLRAEVRNKITTVLSEEQRQQLQDIRWSGRKFGPGPKGF
jgi:Spy/CpxP family protein refolding chaperone